MPRYGRSARVEPMSWKRAKLMSVMLGKDKIWNEGKWYQSIDWGGSSLEGEVLTVSTQPMRGSLVSIHSICAQQVGLEL